MMVFELSELVVAVVGVTAFDARLPSTKPLFVLFLGELGIFPQEKIRLRLIGRAKDIRFIYEPFLEKRIGRRVDAVNAAVLIVRKPDQKSVNKIAIITE